MGQERSSPCGRVSGPRHKAWWPSGPLGPAEAQPSPDGGLLACRHAARLLVDQGVCGRRKSLRELPVGRDSLACRLSLVDSGKFLRTFPEPKLYHLLPKSNGTCPPCGPSIGGQTS